MSKEKWVMTHGVPLKGALEKIVDKNTRPVCVVDNGNVHRVQSPWQPPKAWFMVPVSKLIEVEPSVASVIS